MICLCNIVLKVWHVQDEKWNFVSFIKEFITNIPSSILLSRFRNVACVPLFSWFSSNSPGYMHLKDFENSSSAFIAQNYIKL